VSEDQSSVQTPINEQAVYAGGYVGGLLTARFFALRNSLNSGAFLSAAPSEIPTIVYLILERLPRAIVDDALFGVSWRALDHLLLCDSAEELGAALAASPGQHFH
jgi:hypothetical protein